MTVESTASFCYVLVGKLGIFRYLPDDYSFEVMGEGYCTGLDFLVFDVYPSACPLFFCALLQDIERGTALLKNHSSVCAIMPHFILTKPLWF